MNAIMQMRKINQKSGEIMIYLCQLKLTFQQISKSFFLHLVLILKILKLENSMHLNVIVNLLYMIYCRITLIISIFLKMALIKNI